MAHTILPKFLAVFPYKIETQQPLQNVSVEKRKMFANELKEIIDGNNINVNSL